jgi:hypothetical protein
MRSGITTTVTRAQQSDVARDLSGAYALLKGQGKSEEEIAGFMSSMDQGTDLNAGSIAKRISDEFGINANASQLRNLGYGDVAMTYRSKGGATDLSMGKDLDLIQRQRRQMLRHMLEQRGKGDLMTKLEGKSITGATIHEALGGGAFADEMVGAFRSVDEANSLAMANMSSREVDLFTAGRDNKKELDRIAAQAGVRVDLGKMSEGLGTLSGLRNLSKLATDKPGTFSDFMKIALGNTGIDLKDKRYAKLLPNLQTMLKSTSTRTGKEAAMSQIGLSRAMKSLTSGSPEDARKAAELFGDKGLSPEQLEERVREFAESDTQAMRQLNIEENVGKYMKSKHYGKGQEGDARKRAEAVVTGKELLEKEDYLTISKKNKDKFKDTLKARTAALETLEEGGMAKDLKEFWKSSKGDKDLMSKEEFESAMSRESAVSAGMSGTPTEQMSSAIQAILALLTNNLPK